ncbi:type II toxin-antitoxin system prevent-host-death family antitoxin [Nocardia sp. AG03]|uniref:type II toxin-antitoxin system Phd/YefM family antitoxin n=1 Tax=Nocardia sp. AG03 TaxID=3025312 RepID=UPI002418A8B1|nr:type II toxin-antitoxin system prevent-host-death family antitoxin [Nocardia sp. AG03]
MRQISYTEARATLAKVLDTATDDLEEVVVTRAGHEPAVVVSLREYEALKETAHLLGTPANARHLQRGLEQYTAGGFTPRERIDVPEDNDDADAPGVA